MRMSLLSAVACLSVSALAACGSDSEPQRQQGVSAAPSAAPSATPPSSPGYPTLPPGSPPFPGTPPTFQPSLDGGTGALVNSIDTILDDMRLLNDAPLAGVPTGPGWATGPGQVIMGNDPRGTRTPTWWQPADQTYKNDTYWTIILPWVVIFDGVGHAAPNTRVEMRNLTVYAKLKSTGMWSLVHAAGTVDGELYPKHLQGDATTPPDQRIAGNVTSVKPPGGDLVFHGWGNQKSIDGPDLDAIFVTMQARLAVDAPLTDDRDAAKLLIHVGADYYPTAQNKASDFAPSSYLPGVGLSRAKFVGKDWKSFNFATVDVGYQDPGGAAITEAVFRAAPPPLE